jgi:L-alanine-DL-glutamate epimerase-like enolase superfamily enzyme
MNSTAVQIQQVQLVYEEYCYRTPIKFGGAAVDRVTLLNIDCTVRTSDGRLATGFGSMPLGNVWSFPSRVMPYETTLETMKRLAGRIAQISLDSREFGHPIDLTWAMEERLIQAASELSREMGLPEPIPPLCTLVTASPFDAALHDAFGKLHGLNCYYTYGPEFLSHDLGHYLGEDFRGERLQDYVSRHPLPSLPLYHLVGALDPIEDADIATRVADGLPETLAQWIVFNGLTHLKIKLDGRDLAWDVNRVVHVDRAATRTQRKLGVSGWFYSLDFNERCQDVSYLVEFLSKLREAAPQTLSRIQYIEQPTTRDLKSHRDQRMHEVSRLLPVVIDESLVDLESLRLARELGYTGAALKACKGQTQSILMAAAAQKYGMFLCVQDLTCPGASLIHSAGLAAHVPGVAAIEANARQYVPAANAPWADRFPGIFSITNGMLRTGTLTGLGLGAVPPSSPAPSRE